MSHYEVYESCIRGHHVYKDLWTPVVREGLLCRINFTSFVAKAIEEDGMHLDRGPPRLGST